MCCFEMTAIDDRGEKGLVRKTTRIITNAPEIVDATARRCQGGHSHVHLLSVREKHVAVYPLKFSQAVLKGLFLGSNGVSEAETEKVSSISRGQIFVTQKRIRRLKIPVNMLMI